MQTISIKYGATAPERGETPLPIQTLNQNSSFRLAISVAIIYAMLTLNTTASSMQAAALGKANKPATVQLSGAFMSHA